MTANPRRSKRTAHPDTAPVLPRAPESPLIGLSVAIRGVVAHAVEPDGALCIDTGHGFLWASREDCGLAPDPAFAPDADLFG